MEHIRDLYEAGLISHKELIDMAKAKGWKVYGRTKTRLYFTGEGASLGVTRLYK